MSDLRKCCSDEDLSTALWSFFSSFTIFLFFLYPFNDVRKLRIGVDRVVAHSTYYVTKQPLAPRDIISNVPAINRRRVFGVYFITSLTSEYFPVYNLDK